MADYVERRTRAVETRIGQAEAQALAEVRARAVDVAAAAAAKILSERSADGATGQRLFDQSLQSVRTHLGRA
jgi:F-type H+-transporting ATPase subunit b